MVVNIEPGTDLGAVAWVDTATSEVAFYSEDRLSETVFDFGDIDSIRATHMTDAQNQSYQKCLAAAATTAAQFPKRKFPAPLLGSMNYEGLDHQAQMEPEPMTQSEITATILDDIANSTDRLQAAGDWIAAITTSLSAVASEVDPEYDMYLSTLCTRPTAQHRKHPAS